MYFVFCGGFKVEGVWQSNGDLVKIRSIRASSINSISALKYPQSYSWTTLVSLFALVLFADYMIIFYY
jgi:hypothetical protein